MRCLALRASRPPSRAADTRCADASHALCPSSVAAGTFFVDGAVDPCTEMAFVAHGEITIFPKVSAHALRRRSLSKCLPLAPCVPKAAARRRFLPSLGSGRGTRPTSRASYDLEAQSSLEGCQPPSPTARSESSGGSGGDFRATAPSVASSGSAAASRAVGSKRPGTWFGHIELLAVYDEALAKGVDTGMTSDIPWNHSFKARVPTELLLLVKDDVFLLLEGALRRLAGRWRAPALAGRWRAPASQAAGVLPPRRPLACSRPRPLSLLRPPSFAHTLVRPHPRSPTPSFAHFLHLPSCAHPPAPTLLRPSLAGHRPSAVPAKVLRPRRLLTARRLPIPS